MVQSTCRKFELNLSGLTVLTEAASGPFISTALAAAFAGARVLAICRDSKYGTVEEVIGRGRNLAEALGVGCRIEFFEGLTTGIAAKADIVTNLGFVRPIDSRIIAALPPHAVICLMWEPWEIRDGDIDFAAATRHGIPVIATNEHHPHLRTFEFVGMLAAKLLLDANIEILFSRVGVVASDPFGGAIRACLKTMGADVVMLQAPLDSEVVTRTIESLDALVIAEHRDHNPVIGTGGINVRALAKSDVPVVHIAGTVDAEAMSRMGVQKVPAHYPAPGFMAVTTSYVGPRPVIDLHCAGLRVGEIAVRARLRGATASVAVAEAVATGYGLSTGFNG